MLSHTHTHTYLFSVIKVHNQNKIRYDDTGELICPAIMANGNNNIKTKNVQTESVKIAMP